MDAAAGQALTRAGWTPERRIDVAPIAAALEEEGFSVSPVARSFLERFGNLHFALPERRSFFSAEELFHLDAAAAARHWYAELVGEAGRVAGTTLCPIGEMHDGHTVLMMDGEGRSFAATEQEVFAVADTPAGLLEFFYVPGRSFRKLGRLADDGR